MPGRQWPVLPSLDGTEAEDGAHLLDVVKVPDASLSSHFPEGRMTSDLKSCPECRKPCEPAQVYSWKLSLPISAHLVPR